VNFAFLYGRTALAIQKQKEEIEDVRSGATMEPSLSLWMNYDELEFCHLGLSTNRVYIPIFPKCHWLFYDQCENCHVGFLPVPEVPFQDDLQNQVVAIRKSKSKAEQAIQKEREALQNEKLRLAEESQARRSRSTYGHLSGFQMARWVIFGVKR